MVLPYMLAAGVWNLQFIKTTMDRVHYLEISKSNLLESSQLCSSTAYSAGRWCFQMSCYCSDTNISFAPPNKKHRSKQLQLNYTQKSTPAASIKLLKHPMELSPDFNIFLTFFFEIVICYKLSPLS